MRNSEEELRRKGSTNFGKAFDAASTCIARQGRLRELYWLMGGQEFRMTGSVVYDC